MIVGPGDFVARSSAALFGVVLVCCTLLLRRELGRVGALVAAALYALSPTFMYFSRFYREDIFVAFWAFLSVALFMNYLATRRRGYLFGAAAAMAFMFCVKENSYMYLAIFVSFIVLAKMFERFIPCAAPEGLAEGETAPCITDSASRGGRLVNTLICLAIFFGIFYLFFTSFFSNMPGFLDGLYRKSLSYWMYQHKIERIKGPFTYFCPIAATYELPILAIFFAGLVALLKRGRLSMVVLIMSSAVAIPLMLLWHQDLTMTFWDTKCHMISTIHIVFAVYVLTLGLAATCTYLKEGRRFPAFLAYWSWTSILLYSYAGEKVPWLIMHALLPIILWTGLLLGEFLESARFARRPAAYAVLLGIGLLLLLQASLRLCFVNEANPVECMVYTQTSVDIKKSIQTIADLAEESGKGLNFPMGIQGESTWPYTWYLRDYKEWFHPGNFASPSKAVVVVDWEKRRDFSNVLEPNYKEKRLKLREWWVPAPLASLKATDRGIAEKIFGRRPLTVLIADLSYRVRALLAYYFQRRVWSVLGSQDIAFYIRKDLIGEAMGSTELAAATETAVRPGPKIPEKYANIGVVSPVRSFGERGSAKGGLNEPRGIWVDGAGAIYVADTKNHRWQKFDKNGKALLSVGTEGSGPSQFKEPMGIAVDDAGNIYVADTWNHRIQKFDAAGAFITQWGGGEGGFWAPKGMDFDSAGNLYVVDTGRHRVQKFTRDGKFLLVWGERGENPGEFSEPVGIAIERNGIVTPADERAGKKETRGDIVYVADTANKRVQKFDAGGRFLGQFGVLGWEEYYTEPFIALDRSGRIWLTDGYNNRVEIFDRSGRLLGLWSAKGFQPGAFNIPKGIFIRGGTLYISDTYNHRIQTFNEKNVYSP
jgi:uncharacterized protein (TIGR03663 family)